jgi:two-component system response regulator
VRESIHILVADDDEDAKFLIREAIVDCGIHGPVSFVSDGQDLIDHLQRTGNYANLAGVPLPDLVLLDLNMPRMDGREALEQIKSDPKLKHIPIVILTTSEDTKDINRSYAAGVNSFISKPDDYDQLIDIFKTLYQYWLKIASLPTGCAGPWQTWSKV